MVGLRRILTWHVAYYHYTRTHRSLAKGALFPRYSARVLAGPPSRA
jgi:hypothetical protein